MTSEAQRRTWRRMDEALVRLKAAIPDPTTPGEDFPLRVIEALHGMGFDAWIELDERSGWRDFGAWFSLVRQTRNSPKFASDLIKAVNGKRPRAS